jgi:glycerol uptake facilitator-like aquaporin
VTAVLGRRLLVEFVGAALLVIFGAGAVVAASEVGQGRLDYAGLGMIGLSFALVIAAVVEYVRHDVFGGSTPWGEFWMYWAGPLVGARGACLCPRRAARTSRGRGAVGHRR